MELQRPENSLPLTPEAAQYHRKFCTYDDPDTICTKLAIPGTTPPRCEEHAAPEVREAYQQEIEAAKKQARAELQARRNVRAGLPKNYEAP